MYPLPFNKRMLVNYAELLRFLADRDADSIAKTIKNGLIKEFYTVDRPCNNNPSDTLKNVETSVLGLVAALGRQAHLQAYLDSISDSALKSAALHTMLHSAIEHHRNDQINFCLAHDAFQGISIDSDLLEVTAYAGPEALFEYFLENTTEDLNNKMKEYALDMDESDSDMEDLKADLKYALAFNAVAGGQVGILQGLMIKFDRESIIAAIVEKLTFDEDESSDSDDDNGLGETILDKVLLDDSDEMLTYILSIPEIQQKLPEIGLRALIFAIINKSKNLRCLLDQQTIDLIIDEHYENVIHASVLEGDLCGFKQLMKFDSIRNRLLTEQSLGFSRRIGEAPYECFTAGLILAIESGNKEVAECIFESISREKQQELLMSPDFSGDNFLIWASQSKRLEIVQYVLSLSETILHRFHNQKITHLQNLMMPVMKRINRYEFIFKNPTTESLPLFNFLLDAVEPEEIDATLAENLNNYAETFVSALREENRKKQSLIPSDEIIYYPIEIDRAYLLLEMLDRVQQKTGVNRQAYREFISSFPRIMGDRTALERKYSATLFGGREIGRKQVPDSFSQPKLILPTDSASRVLTPFRSVI